MLEALQNQRKVTFAHKIKTLWLKKKFGMQLQTVGPIRVLGKLPIFKLPGSSRIVLGEKVVLNSDFNNSNTALTNRCTLACGLKGVIEIGAHTMINGGSITAYHKVTIGRNCQIASNSFISDTDFHPVNPNIRLKESMGYKINHNEVNKKEVHIGNNVWIGWGAIILKGVSIGDNSIVAAGSVVLTSFPSDVLIAGNPAVIKKELKF